MCIYIEVVILVACHFEQIKKANVDHFSSGEMIPKCELLLQWPHKDKPHVCLVHDIELTGTKGCSYFTLYIPDAGERCQVVWTASIASFLSSWVLKFKSGITLICCPESKCQQGSIEVYPNCFSEIWKHLWVPSWCENVVVWFPSSLIGPYMRFFFIKNTFCDLYSSVYIDNCVYLQEI